MVDVMRRLDGGADTEFLAVADEVPRRRVRGLRFPVLPSMPLVAQLGGGGAALAGSFSQFGAGITLIVGGIAAVVLGMLREAGRI